MAVAKVILNGNTLIDTTDKTVTSGGMLSGVTALKNDGTSITGSIVSQAAQTIHPSTSDQTIASGNYLTGAQTVKGVLLTNLSAGNIKKDVVVKVGDSTDDDCVTSVTGTYEGGGGGGASNIVTGTFTGTSNGSLAIDLGYSGNGYPISYYIFSKEGKRTDTGIVMYAKVLRDTSVSPTYAVASDYSILIYHTTANATMTYSGKSSVVFTYTQAADGINLAAAMSDKTTLNVYIGTGKDNFTVDKEYVYVVVYRE